MPARTRSDGIVISSRVDGRGWTVGTPDTVPASSASGRSSFLRPTRVKQPYSGPGEPCGYPPTPDLPAQLVRHPGSPRAASPATSGSDPRHPPRTRAYHLTADVGPGPSYLEARGESVLAARGSLTWDREGRTERSPPTVGDPLSRGSAEFPPEGTHVSPGVFPSRHRRGPRPARRRTIMRRRPAPPQHGIDIQKHQITTRIPPARGEGHLSTLRRTGETRCVFRSPPTAPPGSSRPGGR